MGVTSALFKVYFLLYFLPDIISTLGTTTSHRNVSISRDHVSIWFQPPFEKESQYEKENLKEMISLVGSQFGTLLINSAPDMLELVPPEAVNNSLLLIPGLVAKHNEEHPNERMKVIMSFIMSKDFYPYSSSDLTKTRIESSLEVAKHVADEVNSLHSGTVDTLLLIDNTFLPLKQDFHDTKTKSLSQIYLNVLMAGTELRNPNSGLSSYKLGVVIPYEKLWMRGTSLEIDQLKRIFMNVDLVVPLIYFKEIYAKPEDEHSSLIQAFDDCKRIVKEGGKDVEIIPLFSCKPTISRNSKDISKFLQCWNLMSDWAKKNNQSIIMYEAFDQYMAEYRKKHDPAACRMPPPFKTNKAYFQSPLLDAGWWRLKSEMLSRNSQTGALKVNASCFIPKADETFGMSLKIGERFSPKTAIYFDYHVRDLTQYKHYYDSEVREMLELISTRFSSIAIENKVDDLNVNRTIPIIAANLNRDNLNNSSFKPLTIIYSFLFDRRHPKELKEMLQDIKDIHLANAIFPGTVHTFAIDYDKYKSREERKAQWETLKVALDMKYAGTNNISYPHNFHAKTTANPVHNSSSIRLGMHVNLGDDMFLKDESQPDIKLLDVIIVYISSSYSFHYQHQYADSILNYLFAFWKDYRKTIQSKYPNVDVLLSVDCSHVTRQYPSIEPAAKCWDMVNEWANDNQGEVIFHQAFGIHDKTLFSSDEYLQSIEVVNGLESWWTLKPNSEIQINMESFVETFRDLMTPSSDSGSDMEEQTLVLKQEDNQVSNLNKSSGRVESEEDNQVSNLNKSSGRVESEEDNNVSNLNKSSGRVESEEDNQISNLNKSSGRVESEEDNNVSNLNKSSGRVESEEDNQISNLNKSSGRVESEEENHVSKLNKSSGRVESEEVNKVSNHASENHVGLIVFFVCLIFACSMAIVFVVYCYNRKISTYSIKNEWSSEMQLM